VKGGTLTLTIPELKTDVAWKTRAMDNHVWFVVCRNRGDWGLVVRPDGEIVCQVDPSTGIATAELDLAFRHESWIGSDFENRVWGERRPHLYGLLAKDV
jgi:predicted amidohydrolase